jgi:hypothetical protein
MGAPFIEATLVKYVEGWAQHPDVKKEAEGLLWRRVGKRVHAQRTGAKGRWVKGTIIGLSVKYPFHLPHNIVLWDDDVVSTESGHSLYYS